MNYVQCDFKRWNTKCGRCEHVGTTDCSFQHLSSFICAQSDAPWLPIFGRHRKQLSIFSTFPS